METTQLIHGIHAVSAVLRHQSWRLTELLLATEKGKDARRVRELASQAAKLGVTVHWRPAAELDRIAPDGRGVLARLKISQEEELPRTVEELFDAFNENAHLLVLDGITDPHNLGACMRTAAAAGVHAIIAPKDRACGLNATAIRVASGAAQHIPFITVTNLARTLRDLRERHVWIVGTDAAAPQMLYQIDLKDRAIAWVLGAEGEGLRRLTRETCDEVVRIPLTKNMESLNVSVAAGILLFETVRQSRYD